MLRSLGQPTGRKSGTCHKQRDRGYSDDRDDEDDVDHGRFCWAAAGGDYKDGRRVESTLDSQSWGSPRALRPGVLSVLVVVLFAVVSSAAGESMRGSVASSEGLPAHHSGTPCVRH
jgi:hypothetical protein